MDWCIGNELLLCLRTKSSSAHSSYSNYSIVIKNINHPIVIKTYPQEQTQLTYIYSQVSMLQNHIKTSVILEMRNFIINSITNGLTLQLKANQNILVQSVDVGMQLYQLDENNLPM